MIQRVETSEPDRSLRVVPDNDIDQIARPKAATNRQVDKSVEASTLPFAFQPVDRYCGLATVDLSAATATTDDDLTNRSPLCQ